MTVQKQIFEKFNYLRHPYKGGCCGCLPTEMAFFGNFGVMGDATKDILVIPRILLEFVGLWPHTQNCRTRFYPIVLYGMSILLQLGQLVFFVENISDFTKMASTLSTLSTTLQSIVKTALLYYHSDSFNQIIMVMRNHFWSSSLMGVDLKKSLKNNAKIVAAAMLFVSTSGVCFSVCFLTVPAIFGTGELPFASSYPFDWHKSSTYVMVYFLQCYTNECFILPGILGHDNLFYAIVTNCVAQFELLKLVLSKIGSPEVDDINKKLDQYYDGGGSFSSNTKLLCRCIEHHRKLIGMCNDMERIFTISIATQFLTSLSAICVSSYLITVIGLDSSQLPYLFSYVVGHLAQLFFYCTAGNEPTHQANSLSTSLFNSQWYESHITSDVKKALPVVIQRSQKRQKLTALGMADLNYTAFFKVVQLSFSFYTILSKMTENK